MNYLEDFLSTLTSLIRPWVPVSRKLAEITKDVVEHHLTEEKMAEIVGVVEQPRKRADEEEVDRGMP